MGVSKLGLATRCLVKVLLLLARAYQVAINVNRDSSDKDILHAFRRVALNVHPDKGGTDAEFQRLQEAREKWDKARNCAKRLYKICRQVVVKKGAASN